MRKRATVTHFTMKSICTCLYITCNKKILFVKNILAYCGYSLTSPIFLLLSEDKHCNHAATNSNSENARSRMVASLGKSVGTGIKEDKSSTGHVWAAGFHHVMAHSHLAHIFKLMNHLIFPILGDNKLKMTCWKTGIDMITASCIYPHGYATLIKINGTLCPKGLSQKGYQYCHP
jgi:hypothetical protein